MNFVKKMLIKMVWPRVKKELLAYVECKQMQAKYVDLINKKIDIPGLPEESEARVLNEIYDTTRDAIKEVINSIDIDVVIHKAK